MFKQNLIRFYYSFPVQLLALHLRTNMLLLILWLILFLTVSGGFGRSMGFNFLFLDPEYLGVVNFWSFYLIGFTFGVFFVAWNTTTYILNSYRFPFLATLSRPYGKFSFNNFLLPFLFVLFYLEEMIRFQWYNEFAEEDSILQYCLGFVMGFATMITLVVAYFYLTNKDLNSYERANRLKISEVITAIVVKNREKIVEDALQNPYRHAVRVDIFLSEWLRPRLVRSVEHYNFEMLEKVFRQNHANALIIQSLSITALILMSALVEYPYFRIPAAASVMMLFSVITTIVGALTYWLQEWRAIVIAILLVAANQMMGLGWIYYENKAFGLDYGAAPVEYTYSNLEKLASASNYLSDMQQTERILHNWRSKFSTTPPLVVICVSGGGVRAGLWAMQVLREADKAMGGQLMKHTVLMTGASGGMLGASYYRELYYQKLQGKPINLHDERYVANISRDLANPIMFTMLVNDVFVPWVDREVNGYTYKQDRGYIFEQQFIENTGGMMAQPLSYYQKPERDGKIPLMFLTPVIINDGRFLVISPQKVSYMMKAPFTLEGGDGSFAEIDAVDFGTLFKNNNAQNMRFATALRMGATYPLIMPSVHLPTSPSVQVMDAGFRDNYGTETATRFLAVFRNWIQQNTRDVIIIQIRGSNKITEVPRNRTRSIANYFTFFSSMMDVDNLQDFHHDSYVGFLKSKIGYNKVHLLRFIYKPTLIEERASLSFRLTQREKNDVMNAIYLPENQKTLKRLQQLLRPRAPKPVVVSDSLSTDLPAMDTTATPLGE